jgi:hypothetical protein
MVEIVVGSPSLTQPLLLYPGLEPAMLDNIGGVIFPYLGSIEKLKVLFLQHHWSCSSDMKLSSLSYGASFRSLHFVFSF